jgi:hypothetical protein
VDTLSPLRGLSVIVRSDPHANAWGYTLSPLRGLCFRQFRCPCPRPSYGLAKYVGRGRSPCLPYSSQDSLVLPGQARGPAPTK